ncbi:hypothetical protein KCU71_g840, partial [Aureobasidium melanogenum]
MASSAVPTLYGLGRIPEELYIVAITFLTMTWTSVFARAYVRGYMLRSFGWDDWTLIPAQICYTAQCAYLISMARMEMDPAKYNNIKSISQLVTKLVVFSGIYALTCVLLKISLGLFFLRIITEKWQRNIIYAGITINTLYGITYFGLCTFGCGDPSKYLLRITLNQCISVKNVVIPASYVFTALNAVMDWTMALLPISTIWHLNMPKMTKFWAYLLMLLGAAGSIVSLIRFAFVKSLEPDVMFFKNTGKLAIYSHIEPGLGIVAERTVMIWGLGMDYRFLSHLSYPDQLGILGTLEIRTGYELLAGDDLVSESGPIFTTETANRILTRLEPDLVPITNSTAMASDFVKKIQLAMAFNQIPYLSRRE